MVAALAWGVAVAAPASLVLPHVVAAQTAATRAEAARTALAQGRVAEATELLVTLTAELPEDPGIHWLFAHVLLAAGDTDGAIREYRTAVTLSPEDPWLRLELGRTLLDAGAGSQVAAVLAPVVGETALPSAAAEAETILGLAAYWDGDAFAARTHLRRALTLDPDRSEAASALAGVEGAIAPMLTATSVLADDDQPLSLLEQNVSFSTPLSGRLRGLLWLAVARRASSSLAYAAFDGRAGVEASLPGGRVKLAVLGGANVRGEGLGTHASGSGRLTIDIDAETRLGASFERWQYQWTAASLDTAVAVTSLELRFDRRAAPGWAGEAVFRRDGFPDGNSVRSLSLWFLAPALVRPEGGLRVGYAAARQDSENGTFAPLSSDPGPGSPGPPARPPGPPGSSGDAAGIYTPYYTPFDLQTHSVIVEARGGELEATALSVTLAYAPWARELGPAVVLDPEDGSPTVEYSERSFSPWTLRAQVSSPIGPRASMTLSVGHERTAFYRSTRFEAMVTHRFLTAAP